MEDLVASMDYSSRIPDEYAIRRALALLHTLGQASKMPQIQISERKPYGTTGQRILANAFVEPGKDVIHINSLSPVYRKANLGDEESSRQLAAIMAHERHHVDSGPDEQSAYDQQLETLSRLGSRALQAVLDAKAFVTRK